MKMRLAAVLGCLAGCAAPSVRHVDVGGHHLWMKLAGRGAPTVVFENGGGDDASVWATVEPEIRRRLHVHTVLYDRAGLGKSEPAVEPYRIDDEAAALRRALDSVGVRGPIVLVAHSYGGFVDTLVAAVDARVAGVVLVDANLADFFDDAEIARLEAKFGPQLDELRRREPLRASVIRGFVEALPQTAQRLREVPFPPSLPAIDIVSERTPFESTEEIAAWRRAHARFAAGSSAREAVLATGSGHFVMRDRPDVVIDAVRRMVQRARAIATAAQSRADLR